MLQMKILVCRGYMGEFDVIKIFFINYLECVKWKLLNSSRLNNLVR